MTDSLRLNEDEKTVERIFRTALALQRVRELELQRVHLTFIEAGVLYFLKDLTDPLTPADISRQLHRPPHTVSVVVARLESRGLVKKTRNMHRKNVVNVSLTKEGQAALQSQLRESEVRNITACLTRQQVAALNTALRQLHDAAARLLKQMQTVSDSDPLV
jgi:DNA-binding MarR family transcriptional regulator